MADSLTLQNSLRKISIQAAVGPSAPGREPLREHFLRGRSSRGALLRPDGLLLPAGQTQPNPSFAPGQARHFLRSAPLSRSGGGTIRGRTRSPPSGARTAPVPNGPAPDRRPRGRGARRARGGLSTARGGTGPGERGAAGPGRGRSRAGGARAAAAFAPPPPPSPSPPGKTSGPMPELPPPVPAGPLPCTWSSRGFPQPRS